MKLLTGSKYANPSRIATPSVPSCPDFLSDEAKEHWARLISILEPKKILDRIDADALGMYCVNFARWKKAEQHMAEHGETVRSPNGYELPSPWLAIASGAAKICDKLLSKFGFTPVDREKLACAPAEEKDDFEKFIDRKKAG